MTHRERNRQLEKACKEAQRAAEPESCPMNPAEHRNLIEAVRGTVYEDHAPARLPPGSRSCDRTHRFTHSYLEARGGKGPAPVIAFLHSKGGCCDRGVAVNVGSWLGCNTREERHR